MGGHMTSNPEIACIHHISLTVTDIEASMDWYQQLFGADRVPGKLPHYQRGETASGELLVDSRVGSRAHLTPWLAWLDELGVEHTGIRDLAEPFVYSTVVFRDPDNNQLELIALG